MTVIQSNSGAPSLAEFRNQFEGYARPHLWKMSLTFPRGAGSATAVGTGVGSTVVINDSAKKLSFDVEKVTIPGIQTAAVEAWYMGRPIKYAGDRTFEDVTFTIKNDKDWSVRTSFEQWLAFMNGHRENVGSDDLDEYATDIQITQLDRKGREIVTYTLIDAWPKTITGMDLTYTDGNGKEQFDVTFAYQWWTREPAGII